MKKFLIIGILAFLMVSGVWGQQPTPSPKGGEMTMIGRMPTLAEELTQSQVEPRHRKFKMNIHFIRAKYSEPKVEGITIYRYFWEYFEEAAVLVEVAQQPPGRFAKGSIEEKKQSINQFLDSITSKSNGKIVWSKDILVDGEAGRDFEFAANGTTTTRRCVFKDDTFYLIYVLPKKGLTELMIKKLFDSFQFVK